MRHCGDSIAASPQTPKAGWLGWTYYIMPPGRGGTVCCRTATFWKALWIICWQVGEFTWVNCGPVQNTEGQRSETCIN